MGRTAMAARLEPLGSDFEQTRAALHRVAEQVVAPAQKPHNEIALRQTPGGFGTPVFEFDGVACQVRVDGSELVVRRGREERREALTTVGAAAEFVGADLFPDGAPSDSEPLSIDVTEAARLGAFYGFARDVLAALRAEWDGTGADDPSLTRLWPEHFDLALEAGSDADGRRANYGASPGDEHHAEPYLYVGPWTAGVEGELWNGKGFTGAELNYSELQASEDPVAVALEFFRTRKVALDGR